LSVEGPSEPPPQATMNINKKVRAASFFIVAFSGCICADVSQ
jgi:hypothetical protein